MSPGWMPTWPRPSRAHGRTLLARRRRRARKAVPAGSARNPRTSGLEILFGAYELPVATVHSVRGALHHWASSHWSWLRPRAIPSLVALVAAVGLLAMTKTL